MLEPKNPFIVEAIVGGWPFHPTHLNPVSLAQNLEMLRDCGLGDGEEVNDIGRNATRISNKILEDFKAGVVADGFTHLDQLLLL